jgi:diacylglycerol kinase (ATP)
LTVPKVVAIVNPAAGRKRGAVLRAQAVLELERLFPGIDIRETNAPGHGTELARASRDADLVIAIGGDGTIREVTSGLVSAGPEVTTKTPRHQDAGTETGARDSGARPGSEPTLVSSCPSDNTPEVAAPSASSPLVSLCLGGETPGSAGSSPSSPLVSLCLGGKTPEFAIIPVGSGNDFPKTAGIPTDIAEACRVAAEGRTRPIDVMKVVMSGPETNREMHYINAAGFGFDASTVAAARKHKHLRGMPLYLIAVLDALKSFECPEVRVQAPGFHREQAVLLVAAANGRYYGGGMKVAPDAQPDDGLMDVVIGDAMGRLSILRILPKFIGGNHVGLKEVRMLRVPELELDFAGPVMAQLDGDVIDVSGFRNFKITVLPSAIRLRVPNV